MKNSIGVIFILFIFQNWVDADIPGKIFSKNDIQKLAPVYLENKLDFDNPLLVDVDKDGDFDALKLADGNVEYYKNNGNLENPCFILENRNYDKYDFNFIVKPRVPYPIFFADNDGDKDLDMFVVKDKEFNFAENNYRYNVLSAQNTLGLDTGTLITIILVLLIILLVLAIL